jgi:ligand-binding SRPBCC domain-containing protein
MYTLITKTFLPMPIQDAWNFFSSPKNLSVITPDTLGFVIKSQVPEEMYSGLIISYTVKPMGNIRMTWVTEIRDVVPGTSFVDIQIKGPYKFWHHRHHFEPVEGGVVMTDTVHYILPAGFVGRLVHKALVKPRLKQIFTYRATKLQSLFGAKFLTGNL